MVRLDSAPLRGAVYPRLVDGKLRLDMDPDYFTRMVLVGDGEKQVLVFLTITDPNEIEMSAALCAMEECLEEMRVRVSLGGGEGEGESWRRGYLCCADAVILVIERSNQEVE